MTTAITFPGQPEFEKFKHLAITVTSPDTEVEARGYLTSVRLAYKRLECDIKALKAPHQSAIKEIDAAALPWKSLLSERDQALERALLVYGRQVREAAELVNKKNLEKYEKKVDRVEAKAILENKPMPLVLPPQMVTAPPKSVETDGAKQTIVKRKAWRIGSVTDPEKLTRASFMSRLVPNEYFLLDTARIGKVVRAGGSIPGIEVYEEESIAVKAS